MTTLFGPATFTGANGDPWSGAEFTNGTDGTSGASTSLQDGWGRMNAGSLSGYTGKCPRRVTGLAAADARLRFRFTYRFVVDGNLRLVLRADTNVSEATGYVLAMPRSEQRLYLFKIVNYAVTSIAASVAYTLNADAVHEVDFSTIGQKVEAYVWPSGSPRPSTPTLSAVDSSITAAGVVAFLMVGGSSANAQVDIDDVVVTDGAGTLQLTASSSGTTTLTKRTSKRFVASATASALVTPRKVIVRVFTATSTATAALIRAYPKLFTATSAATAVLVKEPRKILAASSSALASVRKSVLRTLTASSTASAATSTTFLGRIAGRPGIVRMTVNAKAWVRLVVRGGG